MGVDYTQMAVEWNNIVDERHKQGDLVFLWKKTPEYLRAYDKGCRRRQNQNATVRPSLERIGRLMRRLREEIPPRSRLEVERASPVRSCTISAEMRLTGLVIWFMWLIR